MSRSSSGATVAAAIVEAENSLEMDVCFSASGEAFFRTILMFASCILIACLIVVFPRVLYWASGFSVPFLGVKYSFFQAQDNKDDLKIKLKGILRDKNDVFNSKDGNEDKVKHRTQIIVSWDFELIVEAGY